MRCSTWGTAREIDHWAETTAAEDVFAGVDSPFGASVMCRSEILWLMQVGGPAQ